MRHVNGVSAEELSGRPARIAQHETDHLNGTLHLDRADLRTLSTTANHERFQAPGPDARGVTRCG
ncbi:peptide deformylase [Nonomuraea sp. NPDC052265]|uniref:peptide deformylase n=1 Tax=Nonomuraea sp. NPDC052265 TaxID=3364374 RepID=UPI0037CCAC6B